MNIPDPPWVQDLNNRVTKLEGNLFRIGCKADRYNGLDERLERVERQLFQKPSDSIPKHVLLDWLDDIWNEGMKVGSYEEGAGMQDAVQTIRDRLKDYEA